MTDTERCLRTAVKADPAADLPRLMLADYWEETAGDVECEKCDGTGQLMCDRKDCPHCNYDVCGNPPMCTVCAGTGVVSDGRRERAELVRVQCELEHHISGVTYNGVRNYHPHALGDRTVELERAEKKWFASLPAAPFPGFVAVRSHDFFGYLPEHRLAIVRRGFPHTLRGPLAAFWAEGACPRCGGVGTVEQTARTPEADLIWHGSRALYGTFDCPAGCSAGRASGPIPAFAGLCEAEPVESVAFSDKTPEPHGRFCRYYFNDGSRPCDLPRAMLTRLPQDRKNGWVGHAYDPEHGWFNNWRTEAAANVAIGLTLLAAADCFGG